MADDTQRLNIFLDLLPNQPKNDTSRENFRGMLRDRFEKTLPDAVERIWKLPPIIIKEPFGDYMELLLEARALFLSGHFYSCVAMCGIVGERLVKDVLRAAVLVEKEGKAQRPDDKAFDQLERVEVGGIARFLTEAGLLSEEAGKAAADLGQLRNAYAHARGKNPEYDATKAITWLHAVVENTVSVFKNHEMKDGAFVRKAKGGEVAT
jgi:hypothetical protein